MPRRTTHFDFKGLPNTPRVEPFGPSGGFTVVYFDCDQETLGEIRQYQQRVRAETPHWMSRLDFDGHHNRCKLHVFPLNALPHAMFWRPNRYGAEG